MKALAILLTLAVTASVRFAPSDAVTALRASAGLEAYRAELDLGRDGKITPKEARAILRKSAGLSDDEPSRYKMTVTATAYCPCYSCSEGYGRQTASGKTARANHTVAADTSVLPLGTVIYIDGQRYVVEDVGGGVRGNHIDIFFDNHSEAEDFGRRTIEIEVER